MIIKRPKTAILWTTAIVLALIVIGLLVAYVLREEFGVLPIYYQRRPDKMITRLERIFEIDFPEEIKDVRAARTGAQWDGTVGFLLKFTADPNVVEGFLKIRHPAPYDHESDLRERGFFLVPDWFTEPIQEGIMGYLNLLPRKPEFAERISGVSAIVYVDTADKTAYVVYIYSGYDADWD